MNDTGNSRFPAVTEARSTEYLPAAQKQCRPSMQEEFMFKVDFVEFGPANDEYYAMYKLGVMILAPTGRHA